jgi:hypothetical protein
VKRLPDIVRELDDGGDPGNVARQVVKVVLADYPPDEQGQILLPVVRSEVARLRRRTARRAEDHAFRSAAPDELTALRVLRDEPFTDVLVRGRSV